MIRKAVSILCVLIVVIMAMHVSGGEEYQPLYVMCKDLHGRIRPGKKYDSIVSFDMWTELEPTGRMSDDRQWVEVITAETDRVWCNINYLTETKNVLRVYTLWEEGVKIRSRPGSGKVIGIARREQALDITQVIMGYGKCSKGWVEMDYFIIDCE